MGIPAEPQSNLMNHETHKTHEMKDKVLMIFSCNSSLSWLTHLGMAVKKRQVWQPKSRPMD